MTINVIDEDDTEPKFPKRSYVATVMENSPIQTFIIRAQVCAYHFDMIPMKLLFNVVCYK